MLLYPAHVEGQKKVFSGLLCKFDIVTPTQRSETSSRSQGGCWCYGFEQQRRSKRGSRKSQSQLHWSVNNKEASNASCVNDCCKILRSLNRVFVFEIVLCISAPSKDPARFVDFRFWILTNKEAQEYKSSSQETNHNITGTPCLRRAWHTSWGRCSMRPSDSMHYTSRTPKTPYGTLANK